MLEILITLTTMALLGCSKGNKSKFLKNRPTVSNLSLRKKKDISFAAPSADTDGHEDETQLWQGQQALCGTCWWTPFVHQHSTDKYFYCMDITDKQKKKNVKESIIMDKSSHLYYIFLEEKNEKSLRVIAEINSPKDYNPDFSGVSGYILKGIYLKGVNNFSNIGKNLTNGDYLINEDYLMDGVTIENISKDFEFIISNNNCRFFTFDNDTKFRIVYSGSITPDDWSTKYTKITSSEKKFTHLAKDSLKECPSDLIWKNDTGCCNKDMVDDNCVSCGWKNGECLLKKCTPDMSLNGGKCDAPKADGTPVDLTYEDPKQSALGSADASTNTFDRTTEIRTSGSSNTLSLNWGEATAYSVNDVVTSGSTIDNSGLAPDTDYKVKSVTGNAIEFLKEVRVESIADLEDVDEDDLVDMGVDALEAYNIGKIFADVQNVERRKESTANQPSSEQEEEEEE